MKKQLEESDKNNYIEYISGIHKLLLRYGYTFQADLAGRMIEKFRRTEDPNCFVTNDLWGGMGSIIDCVMNYEGLEIESEQVREDQRQFDSDLRCLAKLLISNGLENKIILQRYRALQP